MEDILTKILPGVTLWAVLISLGTICIKIASYFKEKESIIYDRYLEMLSEVRQDLRATYLEPIIGKNIDDDVQLTFESTIKLVISLICKDPKGELLENDKIKDVVENIKLIRKQEDYLKEIKKDNPSLASSSFLDSAIGDKFLETIDKEINRASKIVTYYEKTKYYIKFIYIILFVLGIIFFAGLLRFNNCCSIRIYFFYIYKLSFNSNSFFNLWFN